PGTYTVQFLGERFEVSLSGQFTKITFTRQADPSAVQVNLSLRDGRETYRVGEQVFVNIEVTNVSEEPVPFGILGLLADTGHFQTSWDNGLIQPGQTFQHQDGLAFDTPGAHHVRLSICFARKELCTGGTAEDSWVRFDPALAVMIQ
ncbi:MAG: hypothetical protein R3264_23395, partial [Anaerolineae bacterium]|nr:hypothetical protein [Anaerolineae bacterium]